MTDTTQTPPVTYSTDKKPQQVYTDGMGNVLQVDSLAKVFSDGTAGPVALSETYNPDGSLAERTRYDNGVASETDTFVMNRSGKSGAVEKRMFSIDGKVVGSAMFDPEDNSYISGTGTFAAAERSGDIPTAPVAGNTLASKVPPPLQPIYPDMPTHLSAAKAAVLPIVTNVQYDGNKTNGVATTGIVANTNVERTH